MMKVNRTMLSLKQLICALILLSSAQVSARGPSIVHTKSGRVIDITALKAQQPDQPLLVMLWATHCKPCMIEGRFMAMISKHFKARLHFAAIQVDEGVSINPASARKIYEKLKSKLTSYGVPKGSILPDAYLADYSNEVWAELQRGSRFNSKDTSIPLFALFNRDRKLIKIWTQAIYEDRHMIVDFISEIERVLHKENG